MDKQMKYWCSVGQMPFDDQVRNGEKIHLIRSIRENNMTSL